MREDVSDFRVPNGWLKLDYGLWERKELTTNQPIDEELFAAIEYISEIEDVGLPLFNLRGKKNSKKAYYDFRAFIRQAKNFYFAAKELNYRSSALLYYYSFLNLAKAFITFSSGEKLQLKIYHGLKYSNNSGKLNNQVITIYKDGGGVFPLFYETIFNQKITKNVGINIVSLLGYCSDISHEYTTAGYGNMKYSPSRGVVFSKLENKISWTFLAIYNYINIKPYRKALRLFHDKFEQVIPNSEIITKVFGYSPSVGNSFTCFQSKRVTKWNEDGTSNLLSLRDEFQICLSKLFDPVLYTTNWEFILSAPLRINYQIPFNRALAIYATTFYLGNLVRYNPSYLEKLFNSKDAWLVERFIKSAPESFLRYMASAISGNTLIYTRY